MEEKNILIGNGININFGGVNYYTNQAILKKLESTDFSIAYELENNCATNNIHGKWDKTVDNDLILGILNIIVEKIKNKELIYDILRKTICEFGFDSKSFTDKENLIHETLNKYNKKDNIKYYDIGLEDYLHILSFYTDKEDIKYIHIAFNLLIYNSYKNCKIKYSDKFIEKLNEYDNIFTVNYELNIENNIEKEVYHLHGQFDKLDMIYNKKNIFGFAQPYIDSYDCAIKKNIIPYTNTIYGYTGKDKLKKMEALETLISRFENLNKEQRAELCYNSLEYPEGKRTKKEWLEFFKFYDENEQYSYHVDKFKNLEGTLDIIGLSPSNDGHITDIIKNSTSLKKVNYYCYSDIEKNDVKTIFKKYNVDVLSCTQMAGWVN